MEEVREAHKAAAEVEMGRNLTLAMQTPLGDVSGRTGQIERNSPLFFGSGADGMGILFQVEGGD